MPPHLPAGTLGGGQQPTLIGDGIQLRPFGPEHVATLLRTHADAAVRRWNIETVDAREAEAYPVEWAELWATGRRVGWAVERSDALVGRVTLGHLDFQNGQAEITYWVVAASRGAGVAPAAVEAVTSWAFGLGFHRLELVHSVGNPASCRVAEKTGFALEGTKREQGLHEDGWHDMHLHARLSTD